MCTTIVFTGEDIGRYHGSRTVCTTIGFTTIVFPTIVFTGEVIGRYYGSHTVFTTIVFTKIVCTRIVFTWEVIGLVGRLTTGFTFQQTTLLGTHWTVAGCDGVGIAGESRGAPWRCS